MDLNGYSELLDINLLQMPLSSSFTHGACIFPPEDQAMERVLPYTGLGMINLVSTYGDNEVLPGLGEMSL